MEYMAARVVERSGRGHRLRWTNAQRVFDTISRGTYSDLLEPQSRAGSDLEIGLRSTSCVCGRKLQFFSSLLDIYGCTCYNRATLRQPDLAKLFSGLSWAGSRIDKILWILRSIFVRFAADARASAVSLASATVHII